MQVSDENSKPNKQTYSNWLQILPSNIEINLNYIIERFSSYFKENGVLTLEGPVWVLRGNNGFLWYGSQGKHTVERVF